MTTDSTNQETWSEPRERPKSPEQPASPERSASAWLTAAALTGLLLSLVLALYATALGGVFLFDDLPNIVENRAVQHSILAPGNWRSVRPLTQMTFAWNNSVSGMSPTAFHWFNNCLHALSVCLLFLWLKLTLGYWSEPSPGSPRAALRNGNWKSHPNWIAFAAALLWGVHPLNSQAVTYIVQRGESMMGLFFLAFLVSLAVAGGSRRPLPWLICAWLAFALGLASKQVMLMALPVGLLYDRFFLASSWKETCARRGWFWGASLLLLVVGGLLVVPNLLGSAAAVGFDLKAVSAWQYLRTQPEVLLHYVGLLLWPSRQVLDYGWPPENRTWLILLSSAALVGAILASVWGLRRGNQLGFFIPAAVMVLAPTSSVIPLQDLACEHRMYVPAALLISLLVLVLFQYSVVLFQDHPLGVSLLLCLVVAMLLSWKTASRNRDYYSAVGMWEDVIHKTVESGKHNMLAARAYSNLGEAYGSQQRWEESLQALTTALAYQDFPDRVHANLARAYLETGQYEQAADHIARAIELKPADARIRQQAGLLAAARGDFLEAEQQFRTALKLDGSDALIMINLAQSLLEQQELDEAEQWLRKALVASPRSSRLARERLVSVLATNGKLEEAIAEANLLLAESPDDARLRLLLGKIHLAANRTDTALELIQQAAGVAEPPENANFLLGQLYRSRGETRRAQSCYQRELTLNPRHIEALNNLAGLMASSQPKQAIRYFQQVLELAPGYVQAAYNLAALQANQGETEQAITGLEQIVEQHPEFAPARQLLNSLVKPASP